MASIIGKCHFCVQSHYENLKNDGLSTEQLRDAGRIAAVVNAAALALTAQGKQAVAPAGMRWRRRAAKKNPPVLAGFHDDSSPVVRWTAT